MAYPDKVPRTRQITAGLICDRNCRNSRPGKFLRLVEQHCKKAASGQPEGGAKVNAYQDLLGKALIALALIVAGVLVAQPLECLGNAIASAATTLGTLLRRQAVPRRITGR